MRLKGTHRQYTTTPSGATVCNITNKYSKMQMRTISSGPTLSVLPEGQLLVDDGLQIKISGLERQQKTTLHAVIMEGTSMFESFTCFRADDGGEINLATQPSLAGSYTGEVHLPSLNNLEVVRFLMPLFMCMFVMMDTCNAPPNSIVFYFVYTQPFVFNYSIALFRNRILNV